VKRSCKMPREIFRAYDIRGIVDETLTSDIIYDIGQVLGSLVLEGGRNQMLVGRDGRLSGMRFSTAFCEGIAATGCHVLDIGQVPTPLLYFATVLWDIPSGAMLTGSHNPPNYNGLKIIIDGNTLYGVDIEGLYQRAMAGNFHKGHGRIERQSIEAEYRAAVLQNIQLKRPLKIVLDAGNGVTGTIAPALFEALGCQVIPLFCEVDGYFPNHHPDPGQPQNLQDLIEAVLLHQADVGLAFDGDGDRLGVVDNRGQIIWPDRQLILFARDVLSRNRAAQILFDVKCTRHLASDILAHGGQPLMWKTGHSFMKAKMKETGAMLGGEMSGHFFFKERWFGFDDGMYAAARLLEILSSMRARQTVSEVFDTIPNSLNTPELLLPIAESEKMIRMQALIESAIFENATITTLDGLRVDFEDGFGLVRPSNTGPHWVMRFEGETEFALKRIQTQFRALFRMIGKDERLPF